jgi:6-phosphogluconolactonase (cycloisomerase 2 family)
MLNTYAIDPVTATLTYQSSVPIDFETPQTLATDPTGQFLYVSGQNTAQTEDVVSQFAINQTSELLTQITNNVAVTGYPYQTDFAQAAADWSGKFFYVVVASSSDVYGYSIDPATGALTPVGDSPHRIRRKTLTARARRIAFWR